MTTTDGSRAGTLADGAVVTGMLQALNAAACGRDAGPLLVAAADDAAAPAAGAAGPPTLPRVLAYAGAATGRLDDAGWEALLGAAESDLGAASGAPADVRAAALAALGALPPPLARLALPAGGGGAGCRVVPALEGGPARARPAAARAAARLLARPAFLEAPGGPAAAAAAANALGDALLDDDPTVAAAAAAGLADALDARPPRGGAADRAHALALRPVVAALMAGMPAVLEAGARLAPGGGAAVARCAAAALAFCADDADDASPAPPSWTYAAVADYATRVTTLPDPVAAADGAVALARVAALAAAPAPGGCGAAAPGPAASAAAAVTAALTCAWARPGLEPARPQLATAAASALPALAPPDRARAARRLLLKAADLPRASDRTALLAAAWTALVAADLASRAARRGGAPAPGGELKAALTAPALASLVRGEEWADPATPPPPPEFKEELVVALLGAAARAPAARAAALTAREALKAGSGVHNPLPGLADDWLATARIALQGSRACLGWNAAAGAAEPPSPHAPPTTAPVDAWLALLVDALRVARALEPAAADDGDDGGAADGTASASADGSTPRGGPDRTTSNMTAVDGGTPAPPTPLAHALTLTPPTHRAALQRLLTSLLVHWRAIAPASRPRALWAAAAGLDLPPRAGRAWALLLRAADDQLDAGEAAGRGMRRASARAAAAAGTLVVAQASAGGGNPYSSPAAPPPLPPVPTAAARSEAVAVGLAVLEAASALIAGWLAADARAGGPRDLAAAVAAVAAPHADGASGAPPDTRERAARASAVLSAALARGGAAGDGDAPPPPAPPLPLSALLDGGFSICPMGAPAGAALACAPLGRRHAALVAGVGAGLERAAPRAARPLPPVAGVGVAGPTEIARLISGSAPGPAPVLGAPIELPPLDLAGVGDPVRLTLTATLYPDTRRVSLACVAIGTVSPSLPRTWVVLEWGGALVAAARGRAAVRLPALRPGERFEWRAAGAATGHGAGAVTARLDVGNQGAQAPAGLCAADAATLRLGGSLSISPADWMPAAPPADDDAAAAVASFSACPPCAAVAGACARRGAKGPAALVGALARGGRLALVLHAPLPGLAGFSALLHGCSPAGWPVWVAATAYVGQAEKEREEGAGAGAPPLALPPPAGVARLELRTRDPAFAAVAAADGEALLLGLAGGELAAVAGDGSPGGLLAGAARAAPAGGAPPPPPPGRAAPAGAALAGALAAPVVGGVDGAAGALWRAAFAARER